MVIASDRLADSTGTPPDCQAACLAARPVGLIEAIAGLAKSCSAATVAPWATQIAHYTHFSA